MMSRTAGIDVTWCAHCAQGHHFNCRGGCSCADRQHDPDVETAAAMRLYQRPDLVREMLPTEVLATQYRRATGAQR